MLFPLSKEMKTINKAIKILEEEKDRIEDKKSELLDRYSELYIVKIIEWLEKNGPIKSSMNCINVKEHENKNTIWVVVNGQIVNYCLICEDGDQRNFVPAWAKDEYIEIDIANHIQGKDLKTRIVDLFKDSTIITYSYIMNKLEINDIRLILQVCQELEDEGLIGNHNWGEA